MSAVQVVLVYRSIIQLNIFQRKSLFVKSVQISSWIKIKKENSFCVHNVWFKLSHMCLLHTVCLFGIDYSHRQKHYDEYKNIFLNSFICSYFI